MQCDLLFLQHYLTLEIIQEVSHCKNNITAVFHLEPLLNTLLITQEPLAKNEEKSKRAIVKTSGRRNVVSAI